MASIREDENQNDIFLLRQPGLQMALNTPKGRGVFTTVDLKANTVLDVSPALILPPADLKHAERTLINHYSYNWPWPDSATGKVTTTQAIALGLGSLFNHSREQNVGFRRDIEHECIIYTTLRDIAAGEELCISYGPHLWFVDADRGDAGGRFGLLTLEEATEDLTRIEIFD